MLVGRTGEAVKVRGTFVHPNHLRFAAGQVPGAARVQSVVTQPSTRDELLLRVVSAADSTDYDELAAALSTAIRLVCRIKVDALQFVPAGTLGDEEKILMDERIWGKQKGNGRTMDERGRNPLSRGQGTCL